MAGLGQGTVRSLGRGALWSAGGLVWPGATMRFADGGSTLAALPGVLHDMLMRQTNVTAKPRAEFLPKHGGRWLGSAPPHFEFPARGWAAPGWISDFRFQISD